MLSLRRIAPSDCASAHVPEEAQLAAVDVLAVARELPHRHVVAALRPCPAVIVGVLEDVVPEAVNAREDPAGLPEDLLDAVAVVVVEAVDAP
jgi:hypothetical protein